MPVSITVMRDIMLPGLMSMTGSYRAMPDMWAEAFAEEASVFPALSLPVAVAMGAAAVIIQNPVVSRRSLFSFGEDRCANLDLEDPVAEIAHTEEAARAVDLL